jgi:hypothetical protein
MKSWELSETQQQARAKRAEVATLDAAIANMTDVLAEAHQFEGEFTDRLQEIRSRMFAIRSRRYPVGTDSAGYPVSGVPPEAVGEYARLEAEAQRVERERQDLVAARRVRTVDQAGMPGSWSRLSVVDVSKRLEWLRIAKSVAASALAELEGQLSAGEIVQSGVVAEDYATVRDRTRRLRERLGISADPVPAA